MGQSRRDADRKVKLDVWRARVGLVIKLAGITCLVAGATCIIPAPPGTPRYGLNHFDKIAGTAPLIPLSGWLLLAGIVLFVVGYAISRDWGLS